MTHSTSPVQSVPRLENPFEAPYLLTHPKILAPAKALALAACNPADGDLAVVTGPTGVGMHTFCRLVSKFMGLTFEEEMRSQSYFRPVITVPLHSKPERGFVWDTYYRAAMAIGKDMLPDQKVPHPWIPSFGIERHQNGYINMLHSMGIRLVLLYQGQEIAKAGSRRSFFRNFDQLRTLSLLAPKTLHVLVGDYRLLGIMPTNGQIGGRVLLFHVDRYRYERAQELADFQKTASRLVERVGKLVESTITGYEPLLIERTNGGIGHLCRWLHHAYVQAKSRQCILTEEILLETAPFKSIAELQRGENLIGEHRLSQIREGTFLTGELELLGMSEDGRKKNMPIEISSTAIAPFALPKPKE